MAEAKIPNEKSSGRLLTKVKKKAKKAVPQYQEVYQNHENALPDFDPNFLDEQQQMTNVLFEDYPEELQPLRNDLDYEAKSFPNTMPKIQPAALKNQRMKLKQSSPAGKVTLTREQLFDVFKIKEYYPLEKLKDVFTTKDDSAISSLDLLGVDQLTDVFFAMTHSLHSGSVFCRQVETIKLDGCLHLTDYGIRRMADTFPNLQNVSVNGCSQLSDKSVSYLLKTCSRLITISFRGTNLGFVSRQRSNDTARIRVNGSALISPHFASFSEGNVYTRSAFFPSLEATELFATYKCLFVLPATLQSMQRSVIGEMFGHEKLTTPVFANCLQRVKAGESTLNVFECYVNALPMFVGSRSLVVLTYDLQQDVSSNAFLIVSCIQTILTKAPFSQLVLMGLSADAKQKGRGDDDTQSNVVLMAVMDEVKHLKQKVNQVIEDMTTWLYVKLKPVKLDDQLRIAKLLQLNDSLAELSIKSLGQWDPGNKASIIAKLSECCSSLDVKNPEYAKVSPQIQKVLSGMQKSGCLQHEQLVMQSLWQKHKADFGPPGAPYRKLLDFMDLLGVACYLKHEGDGHVVTDLSWFTSLLNKCLSFVHEHHLTEIASKDNYESAQSILEKVFESSMDLSAEEKKALPAVIKILLENNLVNPKHRRGGKFTLLSPHNLSPEPEFPVDEFIHSGNGDEVHFVEYQYEMSGTISDALSRSLVIALSRVSTLMQTSCMVWQRGVVIQEPPLVIYLRIDESDPRNPIISLTVQMYFDPQDPEGNQLSKFLWTAVEAYCLPLEDVLQQFGIYYKLIVSKNGKEMETKPDTASGFPPFHQFRKQTADDSTTKSDLACSTCSLIPEDIRWLLHIQSRKQPTLSCQADINAEDKIQRRGNWFTTKTGQSCTVKGPRLSLYDCNMFSVVFSQGEAAKIGIRDMSSKEVLITIPDSSTSVGGKLPPVTCIVIGDSYDMKVQWSSSAGVELVISSGGQVVAKKGLRDIADSSKFYKGEKTGLEQAFKSGKISLQPFVETHAQVTFCTNAVDATRSDGATTVWEVGMRLEAKDRLNPSMICVATIDDVNNEGQVLVHFDGWTSKYDYWALPDHEDLHPVGFMAQRAAKHKGSSQLHPPKGHQGHFTWDDYLKSIKKPPVPFDLFNEAQTLGMEPHSFENATMEYLLNLGLPMNYLKTCRSSHNTPYQLFLAVQDQRETNDTASKVQKIINQIPLAVLLPNNLSKADLLKKSMKRCWQWKNLVWQYFCPGDREEQHLVDAAGVEVNNTKLMQHVRQLAPVLLHLYLRPMPTSPAVIKKAVTGVESMNNKEFESLMSPMYHNMAMMIASLKFSESAFRIVDPNFLLSIWEELWEEAKHSDSIKEVFVTDKAGTKERQSSNSSVLCKAHDSCHSVNQGLPSIPMQNFSTYSVLLRSLDFSNNDITNIPEDFFKSFPKLMSLDLSANKLKSFPSGIGACPEIQDLKLSENHLSDLPPDFADCSETLFCLQLSKNPLQCLPECVFKCMGLEELLACDIGLEAFPPGLLSMTSLKVLGLGGNAIGRLPEDLNKLPHLETLDLSGVKWIEGLESKQSLLTMDHFVDFMDKCPLMAQISSDERQHMFHSCDEENRGTLEANGIKKLNNLLFNKYPRFGAEGQKNAHHATGGFPPQLFLLTTLKCLDLSFHAFTKAPPEFQALKELVKLNLASNPLLEGIGDIGAPPNLKELRIRGCPSIKTPPKEIVSRGFQAIYSYLQRLQSGSVSCKRTKLMMVGLGGAGKTSLVKSLRGLKRFSDYTGHDTGDMGEDITDGIDICDWTCNYKDEDVTFSIWDFAGQVVYYNTHQFFLSNRAVYLLLWNIRLGHEHAGLEFWLSSIACHAPKASIIIVGSHKDQVKKFWLPEKELRTKYPQVMGFHAISCHTGEGIQELHKHLLEVTLREKYMGERIPQAWLKFETCMIEKKTDKVLKWEQVENFAVDNGIYEPSEILQAIQFLHDLGSVQHFQNNVLKTHVVIDPQWIVDAMACVVSVNDSPIEDGKFYHKDIGRVWTTFSEDMHHWLLRLTEEFDLTFPSKEDQCNIVPCLLPNTDSQDFCLPDITNMATHRHSKILYHFDYLPTGLFNRAQVRLYQFSETASIWKKGSMLQKNGHMALLSQPKPSEILVQVQGPRPDNILFMVHEVIETLIHESFHGVNYDYFIPCADCIKGGTGDPCLFPASKVRRATELKAPFLQCDKFFHTLSLTELHALMPPSNSQDFDVHLERSLRDLDNLSNDLCYDIFMLYSSDNIPRNGEESKKVHPRKIYEDLQSAGYKVWFSLDPAQIALNEIAVTLRESKMVLFCLSNEFVQSEHYSQMWHYVVNNMQKPTQYVILGSGFEWKDSLIGIQIATEVFVNMMDTKRYNTKLDELIEAIKVKRQAKKMMSFPPCFISYCWRNSHDAAAKGTKTTADSLGWGDPRKFKAFLQSKGISCWMDIERVNQGTLFEEIADGLRHAKVVVACVSEEYVKSRNCQLEFRFANVTLKLPMVLAVVGNSESWEASEIGMLSLGCSKVNFQHESVEAFERLLTNVENLLPKEEEKEDSDAGHEKSKEKNNQLAFQELLELAQRKLLRQLGSYADGSETAVYPHLFLLDFLRDEEKNELIGEQVKQEREKRKKIEEEMEARRKDAEDKEDKEEETKEGQEEDTSDAAQQHQDAEPKISCPSSAQTKQRPSLKHKLTSGKLQAVINVIGAANFMREQGVNKDIVRCENCIRFMCEHEEGWHDTGTFLVLQPLSALEWDEFLTSIAPYMARVLAVLKHSSLDLPILNQKKGFELRRTLEEKCGLESDYDKEYLQFRSIVMEKDTEREMGDLARCHLQNGKNLWLCSKHRKGERITVLSDGIGEVSTDVMESANFVSISEISAQPSNSGDANAVMKEASVGVKKRESQGTFVAGGKASPANAESPKSKICSLM